MIDYISQDLSPGICVRINDKYLRKVGKETCIILTRHLTDTIRR